MKKLDIKRALREHHMTQMELCRRTGLLTQNMSSFMNGNPTVSKLFQIAEGIGCDITDLFYPDPAEVAVEKERLEKEMEQKVRKVINNVKDGNKSLSQKLQDLIQEAYPGIKSEEVDELVETLSVKRLTANENPIENANNRTENGDYRTENNAVRAETFCPHCGQKVRVGVMLLD